MEELNLAGIHPSRWDEARARARVVQDYLKISRPSAKDRQEYADKLGISSNFFGRLVAAWKVGKNAKGLMVSRNHGMRYNNARLPKRVRAIIGEAINSSKADAPFKDVRHIVESACHREGLKPPSIATLHSYLMRAREICPTSSDPRIVIGELTVDIPCFAEDGQVFRPRLMLAVEVASRNIVGHLVSAAHQDLAHVSMVRNIRKAGNLDQITIDNVQLEAIGTEATRRSALVGESKDMIRRQLSLVMGSRLAGLRLIYRPRTSSRSECTLTTRRGQPLRLESVRAAVALAVIEHNKLWPARVSKLPKAA